MNKKIKRYINDVLSYVNVDSNTRKRLKEDITAAVIERCEHYRTDDVVSVMGDPKLIAEEFMEGYSNKKNNYQLNSYEYKSKTKLFGIPLIHICYSQSNIRKNIAKGIIAIGPIAIGVIPIGSISIGVLSFGAISFGIISLAAISFGLLFALGAIAIGTGAIGAVAIGYIARGAVAVGNTAVGVEAFGNNILEGEQLTSQEIYNHIKAHNPFLKDWIIRLFSLGNSK